MPVKNIHLAEKAGSGPVMEAYIDNLDGSGSYQLPAATTGTLGGVKMAAHVADATGSDDAHTQLNALIAALEAAGIVAAS